MAVRVMIMLGAFFLLNLFVGVIVTAYNEVQNDDDADSEAETALSTSACGRKTLSSSSLWLSLKLVYLDYKYRGPFMRTSARWFGHWSC